MSVLRTWVTCRCGRKAKVCAYCIGAMVSLPIEHAFWEFMPGALWVLTHLGISI